MANMSKISEESEIFADHSPPSGPSSFSASTKNTNLFAAGSQNGSGESLRDHKGYAKSMYNIHVIENNVSPASVVNATDDTAVAAPKPKVQRKKSNINSALSKIIFPVKEEARGGPKKTDSAESENSLENKEREKRIKKDKKRKRKEEKARREAAASVGGGGSSVDSTPMTPTAPFVLREPAGRRERPMSLSTEGVVLRREALGGRGGRRDVVDGNDD